MSTFINRVRLTNYKSIAKCDVRLGALTFLIGPNGSGKSNFLDALRFTADSLRSSLDHALRDRGGINDVRRRSGGHPTHFEVHLSFQLPSGRDGFYSFRIGSQQKGGFRLQREHCVINSATLGEQPSHFRVEGDSVTSSSIDISPAIVSDRLFLVALSGYKDFRELYDLLCRMGFYNLNPDVMRDLQQPDAGEVLSREGANLSSVIANLPSESKRLIEDYLEHVATGIRGFDAKAIGPRETVEFRQSVSGARNPWHFLAGSMSDGTLRALGVLVALFQGDSERAVPLVGIEEPETALHPAAAQILRDSLRAASESTQVLVTSHSPELLNDKSISAEELISVVAVDGRTVIGPIGRVGTRALEEQLYTAGELLRLDRIQPVELEANANVGQTTLVDR